jgi:Zn-finger nucleic acid-binding protein
VRLTRDPLALSEALYIISRGWRGVGAMPDSLSPIFIMSPDYKTLEESEGFFSDLLSTHPPVKKRLNILLDMAHADIASLKSGLTERPKVPVEAGIEEPAGVPAQPVAKDRLIYKEVCPKCRQFLSEVLYEGAPVSKCAFCGGVFAAKDAVNRILAREVYLFPEDTARDAEKFLKNVWTGAYPNYYKVADPLICPGCGRSMARGFFSYGLPVEIDKCEDCRRIWFDKGELELLQYLTEKSRSGELQPKRFYTDLKNSINKV